MLKAVDAGIQADPKTALGYLELAAKVLDKTEEVQGKFVHFHLHTNVDFTKLDELLVRPFEGCLIVSAVTF